MDDPASENSILLNAPIVEGRLALPYAGWIAAKSRHVVEVEPEIHVCQKYSSAGDFEAITRLALKRL